MSSPTPEWTERSLSPNSSPQSPSVEAPTEEPDLCNCEPDDQHSCWEVDYEVYGVIHSHHVECTTCNRFASHIHRSREQNVRGIEDAYAKMHQRHDVLWRRGLDEGERRQAEAKETAFEQLNVAQIARAKAEEELKALTQVVLGKDSLNNFMSMFTVPAFATREEFNELADKLKIDCLWNDQCYQPEANNNNNNISNEEEASSNRPSPTPNTNLNPSETLQLSSPVTGTSFEGARSASSASNYPSNTSSQSTRPTAPPTPSWTPARPGDDLPNYYTTYFDDHDVWRALSALFVTAHTGDRVATAKCKALATEAHAIPTQRRTYGMRLVLCQWRNPTSSSHSGSPTPSSSSSPRRDRAQGRRGREEEDGRLGGMRNPMADDPPEVWFDYLRTHPTSWPNGVRKQSNGDPYMPDLRAARIHAQIRPPRPLMCTVSVFRSAYLTCMLSLFTNKGRYRALVQQLGLQIAPVPRYVVFASEDLGVSEEDVACHYASCGVTVKEVEDTVEDWAIQFKREKEERKQEKKGIRRQVNVEADEA